MAEFDAAEALTQAKERNEQIVEGSRIIPVAAAVAAVLAAVATLFANHSSISGLAQKNEAILYQSKAADQYNYYESKRIKVHVYEALLLAGTSAPSAKKNMQSIINKENADAQRIGKKAHTYEAQSVEYSDASERFMRSYEAHEIAATLFSVSVVLISVTALMRTRVLLGVAAVTGLVGVSFFFTGLLR